MPRFIKTTAGRYVNLDHVVEVQQVQGEDGFRLLRTKDECIGNVAAEDWDFHNATFMPAAPAPSLSSCSAPARGARESRTYSTTRLSSSLGGSAIMESAPNPSLSKSLMARACVSCCSNRTAGLRDRTREFTRLWVKPRRLTCENSRRPGIPSMRRPPQPGLRRSQAGAVIHQNPTAALHEPRHPGIIR